MARTAALIRNSGGSRPRVVKAVSRSSSHTSASPAPASTAPVCKPKRSRALGRKNCMDALERRRQLEADPWTVEVYNRIVRCRGCMKLIKLDQRNEYYSGLWVKHRGLCRGIKMIKGEILPPKRLNKKRATRPSATTRTTAMAPAASVATPSSQASSPAPSSPMSTSSDIPLSVIYPSVSRTASTLSNHREPSSGPVRPAQRARVSSNNRQGALPSTSRREDPISYTTTMAPIARSNPSNADIVLHPSPAPTSFVSPRPLSPSITFYKPPTTGGSPSFSPAMGQNVEPQWYSTYEYPANQHHPATGREREVGRQRMSPIGGDRRYHHSHPEYHHQPADHRHERPHAHRQERPHREERQLSRGTSNVVRRLEEMVLVDVQGRQSDDGRGERTRPVEIREKTAPAKLNITIPPFSSTLPSASASSSTAAAESRYSPAALMPSLVTRYSPAESTSTKPPGYHVDEIGIYFYEDDEASEYDDDDEQPFAPSLRAPDSECRFRFSTRKELRDRYGHL